MKGTKVRERLLPRWRTRASAWFGRAPVRLGLRCGGAFLAGFLLSAVPLGGAPLPLAAGLVLALEFFPYSLPAALGSIAGAVLLWPWAQALEPVAVTVLCFAAAGLFRDAGLPESDRMAAVLGLALSAAVGLVFLLDRGITAASLAHFAARMVLAAGTPVLFRKALARSPAALWAAGLCLFVGCASLFLPLSAYLAAGLGFAISVATGQVDLLPTLLCGLGLDLTGALPCSLTASLAGAALCCRALPKKRPAQRAVCFSLIGLLWQLLSGVFSVPLLAAGVLGSAAGALLPTPKLPTQAVAEPLPGKAPEQPLQKAAQLFASLHRALLSPQDVQEPAAIAEAYDTAAETVCRLCVRYRLCWEQNAAQTYADLCEAAEPISERGTALREDFPPGFAAGCCHLEGFVTAVNLALDESRGRRQRKNRLGEARRVLAEQYLFLSRFLGRLADGEPKPPSKPPGYRPEFAVCGAALSEAAGSGDRGASFRDRWNHFYVLLCDGMGSGPAAAKKSGEAVRLLTGLLEAGVAPDAALELLDGFYVLQEDSSFSTVDLLRLDLSSGIGVLYKWGAAPSWLKTGDGIRTLGRALPPPGLGSGVCRPEQLRLSLGAGETLIMVSDGAFSDETRSRAEGFRGAGARELASYLISGLSETKEDDATAAVVRLIAS